MSGGVDSSMAAALLVDAGHDVAGVHLKMADTPSGLPGKGCCTIDDARDARRVADALGVPFLVWDASRPFGERVVDDFVAEYAAGRTPNPCVRCNERVKYAALLARARALGFDALATGHHVRVRHDGEAGGPGRAGGGRRYRLLRAADRGKDQTYVLYMASQEQLAHTLMPAGEHDKATLRTMAAERGLVTARKPDSSDVCFIPSGDLGGFLRPRLGERPGRFVDPDGTVVGRHDGAYRFTVGQRRGLGLGGAPEPLYVTAVDGADVHVGPRAALAVRTVEADRVSWVAGVPPTGPVLDRLTAQVRYRQAPLAARLEDAEDADGVIGEDGGDGGARIRVAFPEEAPLGVAPGQAVVLYDGDECLGGGTITRTTGPAAARARGSAHATGATTDATTGTTGAGR